MSEHTHHETHLHASHESHGSHESHEFHAGHDTHRPHGAHDQRLLTIRLHSGLSGDMMLAGLIKMNDLERSALDQILKDIFPALSGTIELVRRSIQHIQGWHAKVELPGEHEHRNLSDILGIIQASGMSDSAKDAAGRAFTLIAGAEGRVHGIPQDEVHFHEVGALDSILDICVCCELYARLACDKLVVSPIPIADGSLCCAHGILPVPAPAVLEMLPGMRVTSFSGSGETVTPTAIALLHVFGASFGPWPDMRVERTALVFGTKEFPNVPNGAVFCLGVQSAVSH